MKNVVPLKPTRPSLKSSNVPVAPRHTNTAVRSREHLRPDEVGKVVLAARHSGRQGLRDASLLMVMYQHGLRVSEAISLRRDDLDLNSRNKTMHVHRRKNGISTTHPVTGEEARALRKLLAQHDSARVFPSERGGALSPSAVRRIVKRAGELAGLEFPIHPHMLRHSCGYALANRSIDTRTIQEYLGHRNITHTVRYTALAPGRFRGLWD